MGQVARPRASTGFSVDQPGAEPYDAALVGYLPSIYQLIEIMPAPRTIIATDQIPESGLLLEGHLPAEWLGDSLLDAYTATSDLELLCDIKRVGDNILVQGTLRITIAFRCSRSGGPGSHELCVDIRELLQPAESHRVQLDDEVDSDLLHREEPYLFEAGTLNLEPLIREQLVLAQDPHPVSREHTRTQSETLIVWSDNSDVVDPRWAKLKDFEIN